VDCFVFILVGRSLFILTYWQPTLKMVKRRTVEEKRRYAEKNGFNDEQS